MMKIAIVLLLFAPVQAEEKLTEHTLKADSGVAAAKAELTQFEFLQGAWAGTGFGADCDEMWTAPAGDCMLGTFRMVKDGQLAFTEFCMIQKDQDGGVVLRLKHFNPDFSGWEEKDKCISFPLIRVEENKAYFAGLTYALQEDGSLNIWVAMKKNDGTFEEAAFQLEPIRRS